MVNNILYIKESGIWKIFFGRKSTVFSNQVKNYVTIYENIANITPVVDNLFVLNLEAVNFGKCLS